MNYAKLLLNYLLLLPLLCLGGGVLNPATAQDPQDEKARAAARRMRPTFFEQERRPRFGFGDFLGSALDGAQNAFADPVKIAVRQYPGEFNQNFLRNPRFQDIDGVLTVVNPDTDSDNFLDGTNFATTLSDGMTEARITFSNVNPNANFQTGNLTVTVSGVVNGQPVNFSSRGQYRAGYSRNGSFGAAVLSVTDPDNPENTILIQVPPQFIEGIENADENQTFSANGVLSIGVPTDR
jgi:hypothetical protein